MKQPKRHTVLVVDDEPDVIQSVKDLLRLEYNVLGATRASEALRLLAEREVHVVMSDQRMPEMSGVEFLRRIRGEYPDAVRLLFTGYADLRAVIDAINQGSVYRYVTKPWDPDELLGVMREACERYDLAAERKRLMLELEEKNAALGRANDLKTAFIRVVGHELRTPLTIQLGLTRLALRSEGLAPPEVRDWLERIERAAKRLYVRSEQLMVLLHGERFARALERSQVDLGAVLREAAEEVRPFVERRGQSLVVDAPEGLGSVEVDAAKIEDSLNQLLLNAIKFTPDGGTVTLSARRHGDGAHLEVGDSGGGMPDATLEHLFEPFFTGFDTARHSSGTYEYGARGLGLGLSVVKAFVEMHGGAVSARRGEHGGMVFGIDLPAA
ncbi:MAG: histidine kinase,Response regulator receiver domain proteinhistidine kinase [Myxococcaceae bacterium]|nr:histidine kinase,Response regulator receiver domain proteinhistidine kinase [Myxococcaceae bacterium]